MAGAFINKKEQILLILAIVLIALFALSYKDMGYHNNNLRPNPNPQAGIVYARMVEENEMIPDIKNVREALTTNLGDIEGRGAWPLKVIGSSTVEIKDVEPAEKGTLYDFMVTGNADFKTGEEMNLRIILFNEKGVPSTPQDYAIKSGDFSMGVSGNIDPKQVAFILT